MPFDIDAARSGRRLRRRFGRVGTALLGAVAAVAALSASAQTAPAASIDLPFSSFFRHPVGPHGLEISDELRAADGRTVTLSGYIVLQEDAQPGRFLLAARPVRMSEHADGDADDLPPGTVTVLLDPSQADRVVVHQAARVELTGRLAYGRQENEHGKVSWVRLYLPPQATALSRAPRGANLPTPR